MLAAIDIHKAVFQAAVLDPGSGELVEERFAASREALVEWAQEWAGRAGRCGAGGDDGLAVGRARVAGARHDVRLTDPGQASALQRRRQRPKTDRLDARWLVMLLARDMLPEAWIAPEEISGCVTRRGCVRRSPMITRAGLSACTRCWFTRAGRAHAGRC